MPFKKGEIPNPKGRPIGAKNRVSKDLIELVLRISDDLDEQGKGLRKCAEASPFWFFQNFVRPLIPKNVSLDGTNPARPVAIEISWAKPGEPAKQFPLEGNTITHAQRALVRCDRCPGTTLE
jgi:hypothetical protein